MGVMRLRRVCGRRSQPLLLRAVTRDSPRVGRQRLPVRRLLPLAKPDLMLLLLLLNSKSDSSYESHDFYYYPYYDN